VGALETAGGLRLPLISAVQAEENFASLIAHDPLQKSGSGLGLSLVNASRFDCICCLKALDQN
jgi:hypothetical protein